LISIDELPTEPQLGRTRRAIATSDNAAIFGFLPHMGLILAEMMPTEMHVLSDKVNLHFL
jgi:hypothetical protein